MGKAKKSAPASMWYVVKVTKVTHVLVEIASTSEDGEDEAQRLAMEEVDGDEAETEQGPFSRDSMHFETWERHADERMSL